MFRKPHWRRRGGPSCVIDHPTSLRRLLATYPACVANPGAETPPWPLASGARTEEGVELGSAPKGHLSLGRPCNYVEGGWKEGSSAHVRGCQGIDLFRGGRGCVPSFGPSSRHKARPATAKVQGGRQARQTPRGGVASRLSKGGSFRSPGRPRPPAVLYTARPPPVGARLLEGWTRCRRQRASRTRDSGRPRKAAMAPADQCRTWASRRRRRSSSTPHGRSGR